MRGNGHGLRSLCIAPVQCLGRSELRTSTSEVTLVLHCLYNYCLVPAGIVLMATSSYASARTAPVVLSSPNQQLVMRFAIRPTGNTNGEDGRLVYSLTFRGKQIV